MRTSTDTALQGFSNHHTHTPLAFPSSTGDVFEDSKHFIDNVFGNGEDKGLTKSVSENGDYGNGIDDDGNLDSGSGSPHSLKSGSTGFNSGGSRVESDDRRDLESEEMDVGISMFDNSQLDEEEEQEEVEEVEEVEEEKYVEEEMEDEHGADFGVGADGLHEHDIISNKLSSTSSRSQSVKMTTVRELEIEEGEVDEEVELEPQQQEEELLQPLPLPLPLPLPSKEKHAAKQKARKAKKQAREGPGEVLTLALPNPSSLYPSSPFPPSPISPPSPASRSSISLAKEEQKGESERTGVEDSEKGAESGVRRRGEAREVGSKGVSVSPQLSSAQLCQHFGVRNTAIFEGDAISKKFSTDYRAKDSVVWVNAPTLSLHWGKKGKDLANSKYVQLDRHRNGGIPLGENKGSAKALVRVGAGLTVTCWSGRTLDLKLASVKAAQEWEQVIEALQG
ncbi:hypothetical protein B484DRAFT_444832 [Ochromonadaceae sp. CCMP2298]|nr:hypothetical protein B484DRAFT_444832 [Ochromonadaceae sp. CCMP2298]